MSMKVFGSALLASVLALAGCAGEESGSGDGNNSGALPPGGAAGAGGPLAPAAGTGGGLIPGQPGATNPDNTLAPSVGTATGLPCDVGAVVSNNCQTCHGAVPQFGATISLVTHADFMQMSVLEPTRVVHDVVSDRLNRGEMQGRMPPPPNALISPADLDVMNAWLNAGAPMSTETCTQPVAPGTTTPDPGGTPPTEMPVPGQPTVTADPSLECFQFLAHAPGDKNAPFSVGAARDAYYNFTFAAPWQGMAYGKQYKSVIDNSQVVHHWLLYKNASGLGADGAVDPSVGAHPGGELVHGWAPGGDDLDFINRDIDVGIEMPATATYTLELHYNSSDPVAVDRSGIEVCVSTTQPENVAWLSWLGTDAIGGTSATGTCNPADQRIHILGWTPHMHTKGVHMKAVVNRPTGPEVIHDEAFDFNFQVAYEGDVWIEPGDTITTTCTYNSPANFGEGTGDEMCYFFTLSYPKGAMTDGLLFGRLAHGENACIGM